jgi:hypothetical protein
MITLQLTAEQFSYLVRAVERDFDDHQHMLECGVDDTGVVRERDAGRDMSLFLEAVSQTQFLPF